MEHAEEMRSYLHDSFGNCTRIDYGTGHELHFWCFLLCMFLMEMCGKDDLQALVLVVWQKYMTVMRKLQKIYCHEPAGPFRAIL